MINNSNKKAWTLTKRDIWVNKACNWIINTFATPEYRAFIQVTTNLGTKELDDIVTTWVMEDKNNKGNNN